MDREVVVVFLVGLSAIATLGGIAHSVESPLVDEGRYELPDAAAQLLTHPTGAEEASPPSMLEVYGVETDLSGEQGWLPPILAIVVLGGWTVIALRTMGAPSVVFLLLIGGVLIALSFLIGEGSLTTATDSSPQSVSFLEQVVFVIVGLVTVLSGVALFLPDDADAYTTDFPLVGLIRDAVADLIGWRPRREETTTTPAPDNEVYRIWSSFSSEVRSAPDPSAYTPGELVDRARSKGFPEEAVTELREVFEQVRYGGADPTETHVQRASGAWRHINQQKGDEECDE